jgi:hypothetical protein
LIACAAISGAGLVLVTTSLDEVGCIIIGIGLLGIIIELVRGWRSRDE